MNWLKAYDLIDGPHVHHSVKHRGQRKVQNNTYLVRGQLVTSDLGADAYEYHLKLHFTNIITWRPNGEIVLNTGGWNTVTTKARINGYLEGWRVYSDRVGSRGSYLFLYRGDKRWYFADGIVLRPDGTVDPETEGKNIEKEIAEERENERDYRNDCKRRVKELKLGRGKRVEYCVVKKPARLSTGIETAYVVGRTVSLNPAVEQAGFQFAVSKNPLEGEQTTRYVTYRSRRKLGLEWNNSTVACRTKDPDSRWIVTETTTGAKIQGGKTKSIALCLAYDAIKGREVEEVRLGAARFVGEEIDNWVKKLQPRFWWDTNEAAPYNRLIVNGSLAGGYLFDSDKNQYEAYVGTAREFKERDVEHQEYFDDEESAKAWVDTIVMTREYYRESA